MPTQYTSLEHLHQAYATEPERIDLGWVLWSQQFQADGSLEVTITLADGTIELWANGPTDSIFTLQQP